MEDCNLNEEQWLLDSNKNEINCKKVVKNSNQNFLDTKWFAILMYALTVIYLITFVFIWILGFAISPGHHFNIGSYQAQVIGISLCSVYCLLYLIFLFVIIFIRSKQDSYHEWNWSNLFGLLLIVIFSFFILLFVVIYKPIALLVKHYQKNMKK